MSNKRNWVERYVFPILLIATAALTGCGRDVMPLEQADNSGQTVETEYIEPDNSLAEERITGQEAPKESTAAPSETEEEQPTEDIGCIEPELPATGQQLSDFVAEGWEIIDSVELDFNEDGIVDYVGVQGVPLNKEKEMWWQNTLSLRILFAIASDGPGQYRLDFQDANLIRAYVEGGMMGNPFGGIDGSGTSFTTYASGGDVDKWSESYTYTYRDGTWYLTASEYSSGYAWNVDDYRRDDWDSGIRICKTRGRTNNCCRGEIICDPGVYELEYEMRLDEPLTLYQASRRWWLSRDRVTDWEVRDIVFAEGIELSEDKIRMPGKAYYAPGSIDENYALYIFEDKESEREYLALYSWQDRTLAVLAEEDSCWTGHTDIIGHYKDKVYYSTGIVETISYKSTRGEETRIIEDKDVIGQKLVRMNLDGTEKETIFTYMYPGTDQPVLEESPPYMNISNASISGGEIVLEVYIGGEDHPYYRMNEDGSEQRKIGQVSVEFPWEEQ